MMVRFDSKAVQQTVAREVEPIGVEGDPATKKGGLSEAEALVAESQHQLEASGEKLDRIPTDELMQGQDQVTEPGPELNPEAVQRARKDGGAPLPEGSQTDMKN